MTTYTVINPASEQAVAEVELATAERADEAIARAVTAQRSWRDVAPADRARLLRGFAGQDCCARSRILVEASALERFMALLEPAVTAVRVGHPADTSTEMGPLISAAHRARVASYVPDGAPVAFRGSAPDGPGFWYPPTVLAPVPAGSPAYTEEIFGPVVTVTPFTGEAEAIAMANDTPYGLSGSIWTGSAGRAIRVARGVEAGNLSVNSHSSASD